MTSNRLEEQKNVMKSNTELMLETVKTNSQMVYQVGEILKELKLSRQVEKEGTNRGGYQPIAGTAFRQQSTQGRMFRPRTEAVCFSCGIPGHRSNECRSLNPLPREEQDKLRTTFMRNLITQAGGNQSLSNPNQHQLSTQSPSDRNRGSS